MTRTDSSSLGGSLPEMLKPERWDIFLTSYSSWATLAEALRWLLVEEVAESDAGAALVDGDDKMQLNALLLGIGVPVDVEHAVSHQP